MPRKREIEPEQSSEVTAYHEAGHAVMCVLLREPFLHVSMLPDESSHGRLQHPRSLYRGFDVSNRYSPTMFDRLERQILVAVAGSIAEFAAFPDRPGASSKPPRRLNAAASSRGKSVVGKQGPRVDWKSNDVLKLLRFMDEAYEHDNATVSAAFRYLILKAHAKLFIPEHWFAVESVADNLLRLGTINSKDTRQLVKEAIAYHRETLK